MEESDIESSDSDGETPPHSDDGGNDDPTTEMHSNGKEPTLGAVSTATTSTVDSRPRVRIKMLSRNPYDYMRETKHDIHKMPRNYNPDLHPFEAAREYQRALNAVKLERVFATPFIAALDGHRDGVQTLCRLPNRISLVLSGSYDGQIKLWHLPRQECLSTLDAHSGYVRGLAPSVDGGHFFSCGVDQSIKQWQLDELGQISPTPVNTILGRGPFHHIAHHWRDAQFATCGHDQVDIWDEGRAEPLRSMRWGVDSVTSLQFNPVETHMLAATASDRSVLLYDTRGGSPLRKALLRLRSNALAWSPMEAFIFTLANEDYNLYTFDMRKLEVPMLIHQDHVGAVMSVDYSPTGREFVTGSYDKTVRIFPVDHGHSREIYHTKRMQRVMCVLWSADAKYVLSGSDEMNIRLWKANASEKVGSVLRPREKQAMNYNSRLKEKYASHPQVKRIARHRHVPKHIFNARNELREIRQSQKRKESNRRTHSRPGSVPFVAERRRTVLEELE